jgi:acetyl esterase/lipase
MYASHENLESPYVSALYGNFENFPPSLIQVSKDEMLYDDGLRLYEKINRQSHNAHIQTWDGLIHWWHLFQKLIPEANEAVELIVDFIKEIYQKKSML